MAAGSKFLRITPALGEARLISAITAGRLARTAFRKPRAGGMRTAARRTSAKGRRRWRAATSSRLLATISSRMLTTRPSCA